MKVYQIIKEDFGEVNVGDTPTTAPVAKTKAGTDSAAGGGEITAGSIGSDFAGLYSQLGIDTKTLAIGGVAAGVSVAALSKVASNYSRKLKISDRIQGRLMAKYAGWGKVFTVIGIAVAIAELYSELAIVEAMYVQGKLPGDDGGAEMLQQHREFAFGVFQVQLLVPLLVKLVSRVIGTTTLVKWFIRALGGVSVAASLGTSIAVMLASEAFIRWLQAWLGSPAGKDFISKYIFDVIRFTGKPLESFWSDLTGFYKKADVKKYGSEEGAKKAAADREQKKKDNDTGIGNLTGKTAKTGEVNGIVVTDAQGYLLPSSRLQFDQTLQQARRDAEKKGQPDPLAKFPIRPGQKLPDIN
jgi:hypothetical protein